MDTQDREARRQKFVQLLEANGLTSEGAAAWLHSGVDRIKSWRKSADAAGSTPVPVWAIELLQCKAAARHNPGAAHIWINDDGSLRVPIMKGGR